MEMSEESVSISVRPPSKDFSKNTFNILFTLPKLEVFID
jgi:hypothetical protein